MEKSACGTCGSTRSTRTCGNCSATTCKTCAHILGEDAFDFLPSVPEILRKGIYCNDCYQTHVAAAHAEYEQTMAAARDIDVYFKTQGKETRFIRRESSPFVIKECADRDELILRFAFLAVRGGFRTLVDVDIQATKVRDGSYQKTIYSGSASPANARPNQIPKDRSIYSNPN